MQRTILITGGAGFVGVNLIQYALKKGYSVIVVDAGDRLHRLEQIFSHYTDSRLTFLQLNLATQPITFKGDIEVVIHLAALPQVDYSFYFPQRVLENNIVSLLQVLRFVRERGIPILFASSVEVYGGNEEKLFCESDAFDPQSPYAASKTSCEEILHSYRMAYGLKETIVRLTNLYGPWQAPDRILPRLITQILSAYPGEVEQGKLRDYLYVEEAAEALFAIIEQSLWGEVFNLSTEQGYDNCQLVSFLQEASGKKSLDIALIDAKQKDGRGKALISSCEKLSRMSGWRSGLHLAEGIRLAYDWYASHQNWWQQFDANIKADRQGPDFIVDHTCAL